MTLLTLAIPVSLLVAVAAVLAWIWAARNDQYEDLDTPPRRILLEDAPVEGGAPASSCRGCGKCRAGAAAADGPRDGGSPAVLTVGVAARPAHSGKCCGRSGGHQQVERSHHG